MTLNELRQATPAVAALDFDLILAAVTGQPRAALLADRQRELAPAERRRAQALLARRSAGEPLAYLLGRKEFYGLDFSVNRHTLIPRPETELLVETALEQAPRAPRGAAIIDIGTGSGCIIITLAKLLGREPDGRDLEFFATDISEKALATAKKNAARHQVDRLISFKRGDLLEPFLDARRALLRQAPGLICANLPYLTPKQVEAAAAIRHEPATALVSGADGLEHYRRLFRQLARIGWQGTVLLCEIDDTQGAAMRRLAQDLLPQAAIAIKQDLGGYDRLAVIRL